MNIDEASVKHLCNLCVETCQCFLTRYSGSAFSFHLRSDLPTHAFSFVSFTKPLSCLLQENCTSCDGTGVCVLLSLNQYGGKHRHWRGQACFLSKLILYPHSCPDQLHSTENHLQFPHSSCTSLMSLWTSWMWRERDYWMTGNLLIWDVWYDISHLSANLYYTSFSVSLLRRVFTASAIKRGLNSTHC